MLAPTFVAFEDDPACFADADAVMFGPCLLAALAMREGAREVEVYLPRGPESWRDFWTGRVYAAGRSATIRRRWIGCRCSRRLERSSRRLTAATIIRACTTSPRGRCAFFRASIRNRRRSRRPRPCDPRSPLTRLRGYLTGQTDGSTDCATLRRRERTRALGFAPLENEMWSQRRRSCRRSGEMWSHGPTGAAADEVCRDERAQGALLGARPSCGEWRANCPHGLWQTACRDHVHRG